MALTNRRKGTMPNAEPHATPLLKVVTMYLRNFQSDEALEILTLFMGAMRISDSGRFVVDCGSVPWSNII